MKESKLEVIAWSLEDAITIEKSGAHRIELVSDINEGGLTPKLELVKKIVKKVNIPVRVMVRDISSSFVYDKEVMKSHINYIKELAKLNVDGIVFGSLTEKGDINFKQLDEVIKAKGNLKLTFHRAFDELTGEKVFKNFKKLSKYDVDALLTSGTKNSAFEGMDIIKKLVDQKSKINISILAGKSISIMDAKEIVDSTHVDYIHVGTSVREDDVDSDISIDKVKSILNEIKE